MNIINDPIQQHYCPQGALARFISKRKQDVLQKILSEILPPVMVIFYLLSLHSFSFRNGEMSLTLELLRMETDREPMFWPFNAGNGLISAVPHDCPKAKKATNTTADPALVNNNNNNNASTKVRNGLSQHKRHSYCKYNLSLI